MKKFLRVALAVLPLVALACAPGERPLGSKERPIKMATVPFLETQKLVAGMKSIGDYITRETGLVVDSDVPTSYVAVVEATCADKVDVGWVSNNQVDAGATYDDARTVKGVTDQFPRVLEETRVVGQTEEIPNDGVAFHKDLPADVTKKIKDAPVKLASTDDGKKVFKDAIGANGVAPTTDDAHDPVRKAAQG